MAEPDTKLLIKTLVSPLVRHPEKIRINESDKGKFHRFQLTVDHRDVGRVIGRQGHVASALRTVIEDSRSRQSHQKKIRFTINDYRH